MPTGEPQTRPTKHINTWEWRTNIFATCTTAAHMWTQDIHVQPVCCLGRLALLTPCMGCPLQIFIAVINQGVDSVFEVETWSPVAPLEPRVGSCTLHQRGFSWSHDACLRPPVIQYLYPVEDVYTLRQNKNRTVWQHLNLEKENSIDVYTDLFLAATSIVFSKFGDLLTFEVACLIKNVENRCTSNKSTGTFDGSNCLISLWWLWKELDKFGIKWKCN